MYRVITSFVEKYQLFIKEKDNEKKQELYYAEDTSIIFTIYDLNVKYCT